MKRLNLWIREESKPKVAQCNLRTDFPTFYFGDNPLLDNILVLLENEPLNRELLNEYLAEVVACNYEFFLDEEECNAFEGSSNCNDNRDITVMVLGWLLIRSGEGDYISFERK